MIYKLLLIISLLINNETDKNIYCNDWSKLGECNKNPNYMFKYCQYSCLNDLINKTKNNNITLSNIKLSVLFL